jgi:hypothetical protein
MTRDLISAAVALAGIGYTLRGIARYRGWWPR